MILIFLGLNYLSPTHGRVLVRPSIPTLDRYSNEFPGEVQTYNLLDRNSNSQTDTNITSLDQSFDDISSYITKNSYIAVPENNPHQLQTPNSSPRPPKAVACYTCSPPMLKTL
jgi:hypothetical protein